ncbi:hypothetical protein ISN45_At03g036830 [Arabidopsis thaliana x Arabidopsis arenosa]|uniref:Uncharacterized protein n=2 Tax=Arabidopsis TaxID=3701 RepID=A0A178VJE4_ARATH|nr:hypothetical protein ISN45_At03g036830 [Arabidopsis thaliana x Arabidopsis arenosa]OAP06449.1 hypothetical protein AXX17_AT3G38370 [Arabidopsis thaliana]
MNPREEAKRGNNDEDNGGIDLVVEEPHDLFSRESALPKLLRESAGGKKCCIFKISHKPENKKYKAAYEPRVVSFGPYHHGKKNLQMIEEHKLRFLKIFMDEAKRKGVDTNGLIKAVSDLEEDIRDSYSESLYSDGKKLIEMMVLDGCFILMIFLVVAGVVSHSEIENDPIFAIPWILPAIRNDLILLENQICMPRESKQELDVMLKKEKQEVDISMLEEGIPKSDSLEEEDSTTGRHHLKMVLSARKLQLKGIKFKPRKKAETLMDIRHKGKLLQIPPLILDDFLIAVLLNCVAFEQYYSYCTKQHMTSYVAFMGCLLKSEADAMFLSEVGILENYFGSGDEVSRFFEVVGKDVLFDIDESYLARVFEGVNKYTSSGWHVQWAGFKHTHFDSPWTALSSCAALTLVILTIIQAFFAAYGYFHPPK